MPIIKIIGNILNILYKNKNLTVLNLINYFSYYFKGLLLYYRLKIYKYNSNPFCLIIHNGVKIDIDPSAKIIISEGCLLSLGVQEWANIIQGKNSGKLTMEKNSELIINGTTTVGMGSCITVKERASLTISGGNMYGNDRIYCKEKIQIGHGFLISWNVDILDDDLHEIIGMNSNDMLEKMIKSIIIDEDCWIGHNVIILKGVKVGRGSIIGAGSVVTRDVNPHSIVAGNPIVEICSNIHWNR